MIVGDRRGLPDLSIDRQGKGGNLWPSSGGNRIEQLQATVSDGGACNAISASLDGVGSWADNVRASLVTKQLQTLHTFKARRMASLFCAAPGLSRDQLEPWNVLSRIEILLGQADTLERLQRSKGPGTQACMGNGCYSGLPGGISRFPTRTIERCIGR